MFPCTRGTLQGTVKTTTSSLELFPQHQTFPYGLYAGNRLVSAHQPNMFCTGLAIQLVSANNYTWIQQLIVLSLLLFSVKQAGRRLDLNRVLIVSPACCRAARSLTFHCIFLLPTVQTEMWTTPWSVWGRAVTTSIICHQIFEWLLVHLADCTAKRW